MGSTTAVTFDGSANQNNIPVSGTLGIGNGGTGATTADAAWSNLGGGELGKIDALAAADIPNLDAGKITTGTFADARIPNLAASKITSGTFDAARIPGLAASKITSGTFDAARIPTLSITNKTSGTLTVARGGTGATTVDGAQTNLGIPKIHYGTTTPAASLGKVGDLYVLYTA